jgi:hypothetical protein
MAALCAIFFLFCFSWAAQAQQSLIGFNQSVGALLLADSSTAPVILVSNDEWTG